MTLANLSAWVPLPHPDASVETLKRLLLPPSSLGRGEGEARLSSSLMAPPSAAPLAETRLADAGHVERDGMVSLGPVMRRRRLLGGGSRRTVSATASADMRVFSRKMVARGFSVPRTEQLEVLAQVGRWVGGAWV